VTVRDRVDERVEVEGGQVGILGLNEYHIRSVIPLKSKAKTLKIDK
jgi:hypothetical protein